ncbi:MAG: hypothetical protein HQK83_13255 [Fibrobacteria bacterium]|nr:hypothetical protein [Fibrobacteria bacterium]
MKTLIWTGGWASNLVCWQKDIEQLYPGNKHIFLDSFDVLRPECTVVNMAKSYENPVFIFWSLGSLTFFYWLMSHGKGVVPKGLHFISLCPIFDYCMKPGGWDPRVLKLMISGLEKDRNKVLGSFLRRLNKGDALSESQQYAWLALNQPDRMSIETLQRGLNFLMETKIHPEILKPYEKQLCFVISRCDPVAPEPKGIKSLQCPVKFVEKGHLPFLTDSSTILGLL